MTMNQNLKQINKKNNMEFSTFSKICDVYEKNQEDTRKLYELGVDVYEFNDTLYSTIHLLIKEIYGEEGADWFSWFCLENDFGKKEWRKDLDRYEEIDGKYVKIEEEKKDSYGAHDEKGDPIFHTKESAWEILERDYSRIKKI